MRASFLIVLALAACGVLALAACGSSDGADTTSAPLSCASYCTTIQAACGTDIQQYSDDNDCMNSCKALPLGTESDTMGDTLGCRYAYAKKAATSATMAAEYCTTAGPGGDGVCGDNCDGFCDIAMMYCTAANGASVYTTRTACLAACATHGTDMSLDTGTGDRTDMGNEVACLLYHAQMASSSPIDHCLGDIAGGTCS
jgi:hypothetical protein